MKKFILLGILLTGLLVGGSVADEVCENCAHSGVWDHIILADSAWSSSVYSDYHQGSGSVMGSRAYTIVIDAKSPEKHELRVKIIFNEATPAEIISIMDYLNSQYGERGIQKPACTLEFEIE